MGAVGGGCVAGFSGGEGRGRGTGMMEGEGKGKGGEGVMYMLYGRFRRQVFEVEFDIVE